MSHSEESVVHEEKTFTDVDYAEKKLRGREFIKCEFQNCNFSKSDLINNSFEDCRFIQCNFSMAIVEGVAFRNAHFTGCKMLGVDFTRCNKFAFSFFFQDCQLDYCTFLGTKLRKTNFINCSLKQTDFSDTDLTSAVFTNCNMPDTLFSNSILEKADFRSAQNFSIDPSINKMKKARFSAFNLTGLLHKYNLDIEEPD